MSTKTPKRTRKMAMTPTTSDESPLVEGADARQLLQVLCAIERCGYQPIEICVGSVRVAMQPLPPAPLPGGSAPKGEPEDIYDEFGADDPEYQALKQRRDTED